MAAAEQVTICLFDDRSAAQDGFEALLKHGVAPSQIGVVTRTRDDQKTFVGEAAATATAEEAEKGARGAAIAGAITGFVGGISALILPGWGPIVAEGPLAAALTEAIASMPGGAKAGGLVATLLGFGVPDAAAEHYADRVRHGAILVSVHTEQAQASVVRKLLAEAGGREAR